MRSIIDIEPLSLALGYLLLLIPLSILLIYRVRLVGDLVTSVVRMTVQLLFVGFYLQVVFDLHRWWLTALWLLAMMVVADFSILRSADLRLRPFFLRLLAGVALGTVVPLMFFVLVILRVSDLLDPQYVIPIGGMIMGNCLRSIIIGIGRFYRSIKERENAFLLSLAQGARLREAAAPYMNRSVSDALAPTIATMMTIGLVSLPGMMTGILMSGVSPLAAIKYQIAIMIAIFTGTAISVAGGMELTLSVAFTPFGVLRDRIFKDDKKKKNRT
jgi:putative ABC transport system permease protein